MNNYEDNTPIETTKEKYKRITVKVLIWLGFIALASFTSVGLNLIGIMMGAIPTFIIYGLTFFFAKKCGKMWDENCYNRKQNQKGEKLSDDISTEIKKNDKKTTFKEKKQELKSSSKTLSKKTFKIATIILSVLLLLVSICSIIGLHSYSKELNEIESKLTTAEEQLNASRSFEESYKNKWLEEKERADNLEEYKSFSNKHIAFIDSDENYHYHKFNCPKFKTAESFYVFNIEYAKTNGYVECEHCHGKYSLIYS